MKFMSWLLTTSLVVPHGAFAWPSYAKKDSSSSTPTAPVVLNLDTKSLFLNDASNSSQATRDHLLKLRDGLSVSQKKLGNVRDQAFTDMSKDYNLLNLQSGMTFWEEWTILQNKDTSVIDSKYPKQSLLFKIAKKLKPDLIHFLAWMRANGVGTFKSLLANDTDGILELESLRIANAPYKIDGPTYVVTHFDDVKKALDNPELFSVRNYHQRMKDSVGDFMLGNDKKAINHEHTWARGLIKVEEMEPRIRPLVRSILQEELKSLELIKRNPYTGKLEANIEVVNQVARRVPAILTIKYFGFEGISPEKIMEWSRATQDDFFHNIVGDETKAAAAVTAGKEMHAAIASLVDKKFANIDSISQDPTKQTILDRMILSIGSINTSMSTADLLKKASGKDKLYLQIKDDENLENLSSKEIVSRIKNRVRTNIIGTLVGGLETTQAAITQVLNLMLSDKELSAKSKELATASRNGGHAQTQFNNLVWEVLRFHPVNPVVFRYVEKDTDILGVPMKAKSHIIIATQAAMFDKSAFPNPDSIVLNRFSSPHNDKYFHLGYGHHRCLGDYVSMIQVPEIIAGILELPNVRKMGGAFGELDFNKSVERILIGGDKSDPSFPEKMILEYDSSEQRPLVMKPIEVQDRRYLFEAYLKDFDRNHYRGCLSGWNIVRDTKGQLLYSDSGKIKPQYYAQDKRFASNVSDFTGQEEMLKTIKEISDPNKEQKGMLVGSTLRASQGFATNLDANGNDILYCRLPMKYHVCFEHEAQKVPKVLGLEQIVRDVKDLSGIKSKAYAFIKAAGGKSQNEIRHATEKGVPGLTKAHQEIYNKCSTFSELTATEKAFYENRYFGKSLDETKLSTEQATRPAMWDKNFSYEDYFSAQDRYYYRGSFANPLGWKTMEQPYQIDFYVRLNFQFRSCIGKQIIAGVKERRKVPRCEAYKACVNGVYNPINFKYEGALSKYERQAYNDIVATDGKCE